MPDRLVSGNPFGVCVRPTLRVRQWITGLERLERRRRVHDSPARSEAECWVEREKSLESPGDEALSRRSFRGAEREAPSPAAFAEAKPRRLGQAVSIFALLLLTVGCGYHTNATAVRLPSDLHTIYVPKIVNNSSTYRIGQTFTEAVVRELRSRTNYRIVTTNDGTADATLSGNVTNVFIAPLTYDSVTGRVSSSMVVVGLNANLTSKSGHVLWSNPNFLYREQYQESTDTTSFFEEAGPAVQRIASDFAHTLVADILEAF